MTWTMATIDLSCGRCGRRIKAGEPIQLLTSKRLVRCVEHATGPVNHEELDLEQARIEADREREALRDRPVRQAPVRIHRPAKAFTPLADLALPFDSRRAAAGDRE